MESPQLTRAIFLDRDGTLVADTGHLGDPADVRLLPGVAGGLAELAQAGFALVVVSNQAGIAKGLYGVAEKDAVDARVQQLISRDGGPAIDAWYYCPHHGQGVLPELTVECNCRKPEPGMLLSAIRELDIDPEGSFLIGNMYHDVLAANRAAVRAVLVDTTPEKASADPSRAEAICWHHASDFEAATAAILCA